MDNLNLLIELVSLSTITAIFASVWVNILTTPQAILGFAPLYYGFFTPVFNCAKCLSGWLSMAAMFAIRFNELLNGGDYLFYYEHIFKLVIYTPLSGATGIYIAFLISRDMNKN